MNKVDQLLARELREHIDSYLAGTIGGDKAAGWATSVLARDFPPDSALVEEALIALANVDHEDDRLNTPNEDLTFYRDCLLGKRRFEPTVQVPRNQTGQEN
jgi:hypothetical protein